MKAFLHAVRDSSLVVINDMERREALIDWIIRYYKQEAEEGEALEDDVFYPDVVLDRESTIRNLHRHLYDHYNSILASLRSPKRIDPNAAAIRDAMVLRTTPPTNVKPLTLPALLVHGEAFFWAHCNHLIVLPAIPGVSSEPGQRTILAVFETSAQAVSEGDTSDIPCLGLLFEIVPEHERGLTKEQCEQYLLPAGKFIVRIRKSTRLEPTIKPVHIKDTAKKTTTEGPSDQEYYEQEHRFWSSLPLQLLRFLWLDSILFARKFGDNVFYYQDRTKK